MRDRRIFWPFFLSYVLVIVVSLAGASWFVSGALRDYYYEDLRNDLKARAHFFSHEVRDRLGESNSGHLQELCQQLDGATGTRVTVILCRPPAQFGEVVAESDPAEDPRLMENHGDRPEVQQALGAKGWGHSVHFSATLEQQMMYVALPIANDGEPALAVLRLALPVAEIDRTLSALNRKIALGGLAVALLAAAFSLVISRRISRPLERIRRGAERFASGDLQYKLAVEDAGGAGAVANAMNQMAAQLDERIKTVIRQRNEQQAVLASMVEGVLAVDARGRLISVNDAAARMVGVKAADAEGRRIQEVVRNAGLRQFIAEALETKKPLEREITLLNGNERCLHATGSALRDAEGREIGAVVVLNDVTQLRQLENVRRDFVANVSHEIKTPITSIKGFIETLLDGAMDDAENRERFLRIAARQADRLNAIIGDLLTLSRLETENEPDGIARQEHLVRDVLEAALEVCSGMAADKNVQLELQCPEKLKAHLNAHLIEQAATNFIDNAIKYSEPGGVVKVTAELAPASKRIGGHFELQIQVADRGCGIEAVHLPRLFERFYRADKARSRKLGGTGLGLAIVKHIAQAHGGYATVQSAPGKGSAFSLHLPHS